MTKRAGTKRVPEIYLLLTAAALIVPGVAAAQETISFPSRSSDLANDSYWTVSEFSEGCCTLDLNVRRWDGNSWEGGTGGSTNAQDFTWDVPLYAPANGVIASCWRNFPDDPSPGVNPANDNIFTGGNHVVIVTDQGNAVSLNHLKSGTIRAELCPSNAGDTQFPSTMTKQDAWRVAAYIDPKDRPRVREGDLIGRAGNSGHSSGPHLHLSIHRIVGTDGHGREALAAESSPLRIRHGWGHPFDKNQQDTSGGWFRLNGGNFDGPDSKMLHASPYLRRASASSDVAIKGVETVFVSGDRAITAIVDDASKLRLTSWDLVGVDTIKRKGEIDAGAVKEIALAVPASHYVLVAVRQSDDVLKMIAYAVTPTGAFARVADTSFGKIGALAMTTTTSNDRRAVTAVRDEGGNLKIIVWDLQFANNGSASIVRLGDATAGAVSALAISPARNFNGVFTSVRDSENTLKVIPWKVSADGMTVTRGAAGSGGAVGTTFAVAPLAQGVAAAMRDQEGSLRVVTWSASSAGDILARQETGVAGDISEVSILGTPHADSNLTTVVRDADGDLRLVGWAINDNGTNMRRLSSTKAGAATTIAAAGVSRSLPGQDSRDMILTALKDSEGNLKLVTWDTNLNNP